MFKACGGNWRPMLMPSQVTKRKRGVAGRAGRECLFGFQPRHLPHRKSAHLGATALARLTASEKNGDVLVVSDLTRIETRVKPLALGDAVTLAQFDAFFTAPG